MVEDCRAPIEAATHHLGAGFFLCSKNDRFRYKWEKRETKRVGDVGCQPSSDPNALALRRHALACSMLHNS